jgi:hypothetical protein
MKIVITYTEVCRRVQIFVKMGQTQQEVRNTTVITCVSEVTIIILVTSGTSTPMAVMVAYVTMRTFITNITFHFLANSIVGHYEYLCYHNYLGYQRASVTWLLWLLERVSVFRSGEIYYLD